MMYILQAKLKFFTNLILKKYQPIVIGITGSIGKTSTKEAIYHVLQKKMKVRSSFKNYNNEIGVPLTVIGVESPGHNLWGWFKVFIKATLLLIWKDNNYPQVLILEMGIDRPGDMTYLTKMTKPKVAVVTFVSYSHLEYFGSLNNIKKEKQRLVESLDNSGLAILNFDNQLVRDMSSLSKARVITYGLSAGADLRAQDIVYNFSKGQYELSGINFKFNYQGSIVPVVMKNMISEPAVYVALAAAAVALYFKINLVDIANSLSDFCLPAGRMNLLSGIKHTFIIDDSYNSSPEAAISAIQVLGKINIDQSSKKYAILGDMLEIGAYTEEGHQSVGRQLYANRIDILVAVGEKSRGYIRGAKDAGMEDGQIFFFDKAEEAGRFLQNMIKEGDILLVKGSQGARMEKIVKELLGEPQRASELLVRQEEKWQQK